VAALHIQVLREREETDWSALTTSNQFHALGLYANFCRQQVRMWTDYVATLRTRSVDRIDVERVRHLTINAWNTEHLLELTRKSFNMQGDGFATQWAFPQAYYSVFNSTLASFACSGFTEKTHTGVCKNISEQACEGRLPNSLNVYADGGLNSITVVGMSSSCQDFQSASMDVSDPENIKHHIITYLKSTRRRLLEDRKSSMKIKTKDGKKRKQRLNKDDWKRVSSALGKTSWLCMLYRKRIKSNYGDIDTYLSSDFNTARVLQGLSRFVCLFNFTNEINIINHLGVDQVRSWVPGRDYRGQDRIDHIAKLI